MRNTEDYKIQLLNERVCIKNKNIDLEYRFRVDSIKTMPRHVELQLQATCRTPVGLPSRTTWAY
jgi:hypothetical protein